MLYVLYVYVYNMYIYTHIESDFKVGFKAFVE
jgi:hypothetical protein